MSRLFDPVQLRSIELFLRAAEAKNFVEAAATAGVTPAAISRSIARLEERLGVSLFIRSTRRVTLTDDGRSYAAECRQALDQIAEAERALSGRQATPSGVLSLSVPTTYGHYRLLPSMPEFLARFPEIRLEVNIDNRNVDLTDGQFDLAIRLGDPPDSRLIARKLEDAALGIYAAQSYLETHGIPETLDDLKRHQCIQFIMPSTGKPMAWSVMDEGRPIEYPVNGAVLCSHDVLGCVTLAAAGAGLYQTYDFVASDRVRRGELVEVLQSYRGRSRPFYLLYLQGRHLSSAVRALVTHLVREKSRQSGQLMDRYLDKR